jgi:hypothetical protein
MAQLNRLQSMSQTLSGFASGDHPWRLASLGCATTVARRPEIEGGGDGGENDHA